MRACRSPSWEALSLCPRSSCALAWPKLGRAQVSCAPLSGRLCLPLLSLRVVPGSQWASPPRCLACTSNSVCLRADPSCFISQAHFASFPSKSQQMVRSTDTLVGMLRISLDASLSCTPSPVPSAIISTSFNYFKTVSSLHLHDYCPGFPPLSATYCAGSSLLPQATPLSDPSPMLHNGIFISAHIVMLLACLKIIQWLPNARATKAKLLSIS